MEIDLAAIADVVGEARANGVFRALQEARPLAEFSANLVSECEKLRAELEETKRQRDSLFHALHDIHWRVFGDAMRLREIAGEAIKLIPDPDDE